MRPLLLLFFSSLGCATDFQFAILGDRTGGADDAVYEQAWREIHHLRPAFVINVGDTIEGGNDATAAGEWRAVRRAWERYSYPLFFTPGNHDIWSEASRRIYEAATGRPPTYSFDYEGAHFTVLDNSRTTSLGEDQLQFLERDLEANRERAPKFVFFHKPFWIPFLTLGSGEFPLHRLARKYGVEAVLSGHGHQRVALERDGVRYIEVGTSGAKPAAGASYHFVWAAVEGKHARFSVVPLTPVSAPPRAPLSPPRLNSVR